MQFEPKKGKSQTSILCFRFVQKIVRKLRCSKSGAQLGEKGHLLPNCPICDMSVLHSIADMRADIASRRFVPVGDIGTHSRRDADRRRVLGFWVASRCDWWVRDESIAVAARPDSGSEFPLTREPGKIWFSDSQILPLWPPGHTTGPAVVYTGCNNRYGSTVLIGGVAP